MAVKSTDTIISNTNLHHLLMDIKKNKDTYSNTYLLSIVHQFRGMFGANRIALQELEDIIGPQYFV